jgi:hypothetical protein
MEKNEVSGSEESESDKSLTELSDLEESPPTTLGSALRLSNSASQAAVQSSIETPFVRRSDRSNKGQGGRADQAAKIGEQIEYKKVSKPMINNDMASLLVSPPL